MANEELNRAEQNNTENGWDELQKGPDGQTESFEEVVDDGITAEDVEYFKANPKELSDLVADLVRLRGGESAIKEGATWDKDMRAYVGEDGLPRDWSHLTGYLKRNPDAIGGVLEEYNNLRNAAEETAAGDDAAEGGGLSREQLRELVKKYPRLPGEKTNEWRDRIYAAENLNVDDNNIEASEAPVQEEIEELNIADIAAAGGGAEVPYVEEVQPVVAESVAVGEVEPEPTESDSVAEEAEPAVADGTAEESEPATAEDASEDMAAETSDNSGDEQAETEEVEVQPDNIVEFPKERKVAEDTRSFEERMDALMTRVDGVKSMQEQSAVWEASDKVLAASSADVQARVKYLRQQEMVARGQEMLDERRAALKKMPWITLPWSKKHQEKVTLKQIIASSENSLKYNTEQLSQLEAGLPGSLSEQDQSRVDLVRNFDARMARLNSDLHTRGLEGDIKMRQKWIDQQEKMMQNKTGNTINAVSDQTRIDAINKWKEEIAEIEGKIAKYQAEHPDFEMHPKEKAAEEADEAKAA